jgi:hypothetical protein
LLRSRLWHWVRKWKRRGLREKNAECKTRLGSDPISDKYSGMALYNGN